MTNIEREALAFLKRWLAWAEAGAVTDEFFKDVGLCSNAPFGVALWLSDEFGELYPFGDDYFDRKGDGTLHECPKRLAWVRAKIKELENG